MLPTSSSSLISSSGALPDSSRTRRIALSAMRSSSSRSRSHSARSSWSSTNSALSRMRVIGVRRSWPAAATRRMRLSTALFSRADSEFSARAVALTSAGPRSGNTGMSMASDADQLDGILEQNQRPHHAVRHEHGDRRGAERDQRKPAKQHVPRHALRRQIGDRHQQPPACPSTGIETTSGAPHPSRMMVTASVSPRAASEARKRSVEAA